MTRGRISSSCRSSHGAHASISSGCGIAVARRPALHDVRDVDVVAREPDAFDELRQQLSRAPDERLTLQVFLLVRALRRRTSGRRRRGRRRTRPACARSRACTACSRAAAAATSASVVAGRVRRMVRRSPARRSRDTIDVIRVRPRRESPRRPRRWPSPGAGRGGRRRRPSPSATEKSPSKRVCDGCSARATPSCALCATRWQPSLSTRPSVTTSDERGVALLLERPRARERGGVRRRRRARDHATVGADHVADRVDHRERDDVRVVDASVPRDRARRRTAYSRPRHFPTVAPRPAPTRPSANGSSRAAAATAAAYPRPRPAARRPTRRGRRSHGRHDRHRAARGRVAPTGRRRATASRRRRSRARTPSRR